jgi:putative FmdB family regulatory protein
LPVYEYQCLECERVFEVFKQQVDPRTVPVCPGCGKARVQRLMSSFAAQTSGAASCGSDGIG